MRQGILVRIDDTAGRARWPRFESKAASHGIGSCLALPLIADGKPVGALNLYARAAGAFGAQETQRCPADTTATADPHSKGGPRVRTLHAGAGVQLTASYMVTIRPCHTQLGRPGPCPRAGMTRAPHIGLAHSGKAPSVAGSSVDRSAAVAVAGQGGAGLRDAEITIVGGGAVGCAVAYALARAGYPDIQVVERDELAGATSGQAAGLVGQVRATTERCRLAMASVATYSRIEEETGHTADWRQTGSVRIAMTSDRAAEFRALGAVARSAGLEVEFLTPARLAELCPVLDTTRATAALWCPTDGYLQPNSLVMAYAAAARKGGVTFATHTTVTGVGVSEGAVTGVRTDRGAAATSLLINAAGPWAAAVASLAGLEIPVVPVRHEYFVTRPVAGWHGGLPVLRIPDIRIYARAEGPGILCGGWEADGLSLDPRQVTVGQPLAVRPDWDILSGFARDFAAFAPAAAETGVREVFRGFPAFSPDGRFIVGPVPGIRGFVMAAACNAHGVSGSAGLAEHVLESLQPDPSPYVRSLSPARFVPRTWDWESARSEAERRYEDYYSLPHAR